MSEADERLAELAEESASDEELLRWLVEHPDLAADLETARRVRLLLAELRAAELEVPAGFEERLLARVHQDAVLRNLLDLGVNGLGSMLAELIALIFGLLPAPRDPARA